MSRINKGSFVRLIEQDKDYLRHCPETIERRHIELCLDAIPELEYDLRERLERPRLVPAEVCQAVFEWHRGVFGDGFTEQRHSMICAKLAEEQNEFKENPCIEEAADVTIVCIVWIWHKFGSPHATSLFECGELQYAGSWGEIILRNAQWAGMRDLSLWQAIAAKLEILKGRDQKARDRERGIEI